MSQTEIFKSKSEDRNSQFLCILPCFLVILLLSTLNLVLKVIKFSYSQHNFKYRHGRNSENRHGRKYFVNYKLD